ncbi:glycosyltransferase [Baekduia sp. Peel2402]|uniref:glycosyltransferase n=1 Tax=Baekduia sp. Peel2402 TaxID=3458296 RepID=UPI00403EC851
MLITRVLAKLEPGGAQLSLLRISRALAARGHQTRLLVAFASDAGVDLARAHGIEPELMGASADLQWRGDPAFAAWLAPRLTDADVVHAHMFGGWWAAARAMPAGIPLFASEHNDYLWPALPQWRAMAEAVDRIDHFYAHSPGARVGILRAGLRPERVARGVSPVDGLDAVERRGLPAERIVYTGRLSADKGPDVLLEAIGMMEASPPVFMLGAGVLEPSLRGRIAELGLGGLVTLPGWKDNPGSWVAGATVQACPSRDEAFSQAAALAMGLGVTVVGTRVDGFPETLAEDRGILVEPDDPAALAEALQDVVDGARQTDIAGARDWAQQFEVSRVAARYEADYAERVLPLAAA